MSVKIRKSFNGVGDMIIDLSARGIRIPHLRRHCPFRSGSGCLSSLSFVKSHWARRSKMAPTNITMPPTAAYSKPSSIFSLVLRVTVAEQAFQFLKNWGAEHRMLRTDLLGPLYMPAQISSLPPSPGPSVHIP